MVWRLKVWAWAVWGETFSLDGISHCWAQFLSSRHSHLVEKQGKGWGEARSAAHLNPRGSIRWKGRFPCACPSADLRVQARSLWATAISYFPAAGINLDLWTLIKKKGTFLFDEMFAGSTFCIMSWAPVRAEHLECLTKQLLPIFLRTDFRLEVIFSLISIKYLTSSQLVALDIGRCPSSHSNLMFLLDWRVNTDYLYLCPSSSISLQNCISEHQYSVPLAAATQWSMGLRHQM